MSQKLSFLLKEYFEPGVSRERHITGLTRVSVDTPISACSSSWSVHSDPERFSKTFKFKSRSRLNDFVSTVLGLEDEMNHHGEIQIKYDEVMISVYTHDVNRITELDQEYSRSVDLIYRDVLDFEY